MMKIQSSRILYKRVGILVIIVAIVASVLLVVSGNQQAIAEQTSVTVTQGTVTINMWVTGANQGDINGESTKAGREGSIDVYGFSHSVTSPRDAASGLPTGKREHSPLVVVKQIDKSTPLIFSSLVTNENLDSIVIRFYRMGKATGSEVNYYTIELVDASIVSIQGYSGAGHAPMETISFAYKRITWTWEENGATTTDDWMETPA